MSHIMIRRAAICLLASGMTLAALQAETASAQQAAVKDYEGHWAQGYLQSWVDRGLLTGSGDGGLHPDRPVSRAEFAAMLNRSFAVPSRGMAAGFDWFTDVSQDSWAAPELYRGYAAGYLKGAGTKLRPHEPVTRQEAAVMVARLLKLPNIGLEQLNYSDSSGIAAWSRNEVAALASYGAIGGYPDGTFKPERVLSRAEAVSMLQKQLSASAGALVLDAPVVYAGDASNPIVAESVTIATGDVTLRHVHVKGDLILNGSIAGKEVILENVTVDGQTRILGETPEFAGASRIEAKHSTFDEWVVDKQIGSVTVLATGSSKIAKITLRSPATLREDALTGEGFQDVLLTDARTEGEAITLGGLFRTLEVASKAPKVTLTHDAVIEEVLVKPGSAKPQFLLEKGSIIKRLVLNAPAIFTIQDGLIGKVEEKEGSLGTVFRISPTLTEGRMKELLEKHGLDPAAVVREREKWLNGALPTGPALTLPTAPVFPPAPGPAPVVPPPTNEKVPYISGMKLAESTSTIYTNALSLQWDLSNIPMSIQESTHNIDFYYLADGRYRPELHPTRNDVLPFFEDKLNFPVPARYKNDYLVLVYKDRSGKELGYSRAKLDFSERIVRSDNPVKLEQGIKIERSVNSDSFPVGHPFPVRNTISVTEAAPEEAVYYTFISNRDYVFYGNTKYELERLVQDIMLLNEFDEQVNAYAFENYESYMDRLYADPAFKEFYTVFLYDKDLNVLGYYEGEPEVNNEAAASTLRSMIDQLPDETSVTAENAIQISYVERYFNYVQTVAPELISVSDQERLEAVRTRLRSLLGE